MTRPPAKPVIAPTIPPKPRHRGAGALFVPELRMRQVLLQGMIELAGNDLALDEMFHRVDDLYGSTAVQWAEDMRAALKALIQENPTNGGIRVGVGYPMSETVLPYISIVPDGGREEEDGATTGQVLSVSRQVQGSPLPDDPSASTLMEIRTEGGGWRSDVVIGSWSRAPEQALLLHAVVRHVLFLGRGQLQRAGVDEVLFSESGFIPSPQIFPEVGYVPTLRASVSWTLRASRFTSPVPARVMNITVNGQ